ncbi:hypothetical protein ACHAWT_008588 [Skeletonema menzelii]
MSNDNDRNNKPYRRRRHLDADEAPTDRTQTYRRKQAAISLNSFSSKKGHDRALQEFKKRKETKFQKNATLLREYQRAMKQEGYEVGKGASRWRDEDGRKGSKKRKNSEEDDNDNVDEETYEQRKARTKRQKSDPLLKARKIAEQRKAEKAELIAQKETKIKNEGKKQHDRKSRAKKLLKRTRKGQPVMKNVIDDLLGRIKSDVGEK